MELKLKFVGINETDVIATSCNIVATKSYQYIGTNEGEYFFNGDILGSSDELYDYEIFGVYDANGNLLGDEDELDLNSYYHYAGNGNLYLCDKDSHHYNRVS